MRHITNDNRLHLLAALTLALLALAAPLRTLAAERPNVILVMTDDQGYGDLACHGNPVIKTPNLDALHRQSIRLTNFHVDPTCSPTRSALLTGRYSSRTGVWHTIMGRSIMHKDEVTLGDVFTAAGYRTAMFGKWHLGDCYPYLPQHRGFSHVVAHGGGGITQTPDYWGNTYFNDTYWKNGKPTKYKGYCTDVFFDEALAFIEDSKDRPFFAYIATNVPHGPFNVAKKYSDMYAGKVPGRTANFFGMITNFDENMGRLTKKLKQLGLEENTILIFMTDNGTAIGAFNSGMRGKKGSEYDGGHRVPFFVRWPAKLKGGRDIDRIAAHVDVLPTLAELCGLKSPQGVKIDGTSLVPLLEGKADDWPYRTLAVHSQRIEIPQKFRKCAVMTDRWRWVNGKELYDVQSDPGQKSNVASANPAVAKRLGAFYDDWYKSIGTRFGDFVRIPLGAAEANPTNFTCHDWHGPQVPWNQGAVRRSPNANGFWTVDIVQDGKYEFTLRERPAVAKFAMGAAQARVRVGDVDATVPVKPEATSATLTLDLKSGPAKLQTWLTKKGRAMRGAFFVEVKRVD